MRFPARGALVRNARVIGTIAAMGLACVSVGYGAAEFSDPMIFFVAKGKPNACGPGCSEWIAADGTFEGQAVEQRLRELLDSLKGRDLPIFFNSRGGMVAGAFRIGRILREHRMTAGVAKTIPENCRRARDPSCRRAMQSGRELKAELRASGAICHSACVFALIGASERHVPGGAQVGVHALRPRDLNSPRAVPEERVYAGMRWYAVEMGVSRRIVDLAAKTPFTRMHILSREEVGRLGVETRNAYETEWIPYESPPPNSPMILKAITLPNGADRKGYRTTKVILDCGPLITMLTYQREVSSNEVGIPMIVRLAVGETQFTIPPALVLGKIDRRLINPGRDFVKKAVVAGTIVFTETFSPANGPKWSREVKLSTVGLDQAYETAFKVCNER